MKYKLIKSWRKTLSVGVKHGEIIVKAPYLTPKITVESFLKKHKSWLEKRLHAQKDMKKLSTGEIADLKKKAKSYIPDRVAEIAEKFGKKYNQVKITSAQTRWGSCTSQKNLNFSYRLMACPDHVIDYVIIHELAHLKEMNHSRKFWNHVADMKSDYRTDEKWLKQNGGTIG